MSMDNDKSKKTTIAIMNNIYKPKETTLKTKSVLATRTRCTGRVSVHCVFMKHPPSFSCYVRYYTEEEDNYDVWNKSFLNVEMDTIHVCIKKLVMATV